MRCVTDVLACRKRVLVHAGAFNLGLLMRKVFGRGTPRGLQGRQVNPRLLAIVLGLLIESLWWLVNRVPRVPPLVPRVVWHSTLIVSAC